MLHWSLGIHHECALRGRERPGVLPLRVLIDFILMASDAGCYTRKSKFSCRNKYETGDVLAP